MGDQIKSKDCKKVPTAFSTSFAIANFCDGKTSITYDLLLINYLQVVATALRASICSIGKKISRGDMTGHGKFHHIGRILREFTDYELPCCMLCQLHNICFKNLLGL